MRGDGGIPGAPRAVRFARAASGAASGAAASTEGVLRSELQRRLGAAGVILGAVGAIQALANFFLAPHVFVYSEGRLLHPLSPATQLPVAAVMAALGLLIARLRPLSWTALRVVEVCFFVPVALLVILLETADYRTLVDVVPVAPRDVGLAHSAYWMLGMVAYGVLIPNTARRLAAVLAGIVACGYVADLWAIQAGIIPPTVMGVLLAFKTASLLATYAGVTYGSYRFEAVARREAEARELGQYRLGRPLGSGGMGEVYLGEHRMLRRPVAIKLISPEQAGSADAIARFEREAQATAQLTHPNTVQVFDYGRADDGTFYCVMEYLEGETLDAIVRRDGPLAPARAAHVLGQLCGALAEAHARGLVHRDLKPGNVILGPRGGVPDVAKLLDFGLVIERARSDDESRITEVGIMVGTPEYMSPEQCGADDGAVGPASDLYSLGALGYFLVAGRSPFAGRAPVQMLAAHLYETPIPPSQHVAAVPPALDAVLLRALAKSPAERFPDAPAMAAALRAALG